MIVKCTLKRNGWVKSPIKVLEIKEELNVTGGNKLLKALKLPLKINELTVEEIQKDEFSVLTTVTVTDYRELTMWILRKSRKHSEKKVAKNKKVSKNLVFIFKLLDIVENEQEVILSTIFDHLDSKQKEEIIAIIVEQYEEKICKYSSRWLHKNSHNVLKDLLKTVFLKSIDITEIKVEAV